MNNYKFFLIVIVCSLCCLFIGFKIGDKGGFEAGFGEGYTFDCQEEITALRVAYEELKKVVQYQKQFTIEVQRVNDSLKYASLYRVRDSIRAENFKKDSAMNWQTAKLYNDSIGFINDGKYRAHKRADGSKVPHEALLEYMENKK